LNRTEQNRIELNYYIFKIRENATATPTMVTIMNPGSVLSQLTNFFFLASGLFNDLLVIRLCLTFAYGFLLISGVMGLPGWGESLWTGRMSLDIVVWSILNIVVVHGSGVIRMYYDERHIDLDTEEQEMLWRFFYRHSGLSKAQFQALILPHLELTTFREGDTIPCLDHFYIILDGMVVFDVIHEETPHKTHKIRLASGDMFPLLHIYKNYMPLKSFFHRSAMRNAIVESPTSRAFSIPLEQLEAMAVHPHARDAWTAMLIATLAEIAERQYTNRRFRRSNDHQNGDGVVVAASRTAHRLSSGEGFRGRSSSTGEDANHPLFGPLSPSEEPDSLLAGSGGGLSRPLGHAIRYLALSVYMPWPWGRWPVGLRHSLRPPTDTGRHNEAEKAEPRGSDKPEQPERKFGEIKQTTGYGATASNVGSPSVQTSRIGGGSTRRDPESQKK
jgi:hypothetical protein